MELGPRGLQNGRRPVQSVRAMIDAHPRATTWYPSEWILFVFSTQLFCRSHRRYRRKHGDDAAARAGESHSTMYTMCTLVPSMGALFVLLWLGCRLFY